MQIRAEGQEQLGAPPAAVWAFVQDPERVAACLPGVGATRRQAERRAEVTLRLGAGRLRGDVPFTLEVVPDEAAGAVTLRGQGGGLGNSAELRARLEVRDDGDGTSTLAWSGEATVRGPVTLGGRRLETGLRAQVAGVMATLRGRIEADARRIA